MKFAYRNRGFWCKGYCVDTVGKNAKAIKTYITDQLKRDQESDVTPKSLTFWGHITLRCYYQFFVTESLLIFLVVVFSNSVWRNLMFLMCL